MSTPSEPVPIKAPLDETISALAEAFREFVVAQSASGWTLLAVAVLAIGLSNSVFAPLYFELQHLHLGITFAERLFEMSLQHRINEGLMASSPHRGPPVC